MKYPVKNLIPFLCLTCSSFIQGQTADLFTPYCTTDLRLPSVPILTNDPYFSIWSNYDALNEGPTRHWCEHEKAIDGLLRVDGITYRFMGAERTHILIPIAPMTIDGEGWAGRVNYALQTGNEWTQTSFDDSLWSVEDAAWGNPGEYPNVKHQWTGNDKDIYVRRNIHLTKEDLKRDLWLVFSHDDVFNIYINGIPVLATGETWKQGEEIQLSPEQKAALKPGENVIAAHCHNTTGGAYIDFGMYYEAEIKPYNIIDAIQKSVDVMATSTYYSFECGPMTLDLVFTAPMLIDNPDLISTPINYISYQVKSNDNRKHDVQFYISTTPQLTINEMSQPTVSEIINVDGTEYIKSGAEQQNILGRSGDLISIDWGYLYIPAINGKVSIGDASEMLHKFIRTGKLPKKSSKAIRSTGLFSMPSLAFCNDLGKVTEARDFMLIGYDEIYDIQYMGKNYKAFYARDGKTIFNAFEELHDNYTQIMDKCRELDKIIYDDALAAGNKKYAEQLAANYRLVMAAHKLFMDDSGKMLYFSKENKSNGCVNTVDLTYPESPLYLIYNPELQKGMILSILDYALSDQRKGKNCSAHDLGQYPLANGQVYGDSMPLEESANILLLADAIVRITGDADWLLPYKDVLRSWAHYCMEEGQNPGKQLCTDDFKGPSEQNTNLSVKAILAVAAYANLAPYLGFSKAEAEKFALKAQNMALLWEADARDGDHYRMEFHKEGSWSQKYNLVWDKLWNLGLFPKEVYDREINFYLTKQYPYGLPLDCRDLQTKSDWIMWTAALAPDNDTFLKFSDRHYNYINETPSRIPLSDFYTVDNGRSCNFSARSVLGGLWMKVLMDKYCPETVETGSWAPKGNHIKTRWASEVDPLCPLPEYPRPTMVRDNWINLNGLWNYAITDKGSTPEKFSNQILVPFAIESSLSGVMRPLEPGKELWYERNITIPDDWNGKNILLNFGAVDYICDVYVNRVDSDHLAGSHIGGHSSFSVDITDYIKDGQNATLYVRVIDDTDPGKQPVGKQRRYPRGGGDINYTSTSGIWQTVWMEPVEDVHIESLRTTPDIDRKTLTFDINLSGNPEGDVNVKITDGDQVVAARSVKASDKTSITVSVPGARLWSPVDPFLYNVELTVEDSSGNVTDKVDSYAAMRKISYKKNSQGYWRMQLNNRDLFQFGPLDQGYWPDGLLTAPTDEALRYDIEKTKDWGFNMIRKHMKVEPARWYYHCDSIGILVWQDMPSAFSTDEGNWITHTWYPEHECSQDSVLENNFRNEWAEIINQLYSHPCIVVWTPFNERWGQFKTNEIVKFTQSLDNTRLVNPSSGGNHYKLGKGTFVDMHDYNRPIHIFEGVFDATRPFVLGEYGGLGRNIVGHRWYERDSQTYNTYDTETSITDDFAKLANQIRDVAKGYRKGNDKISFSAAVYTQTTDVETEVNGIMTYDREVVKFDEDRLRESIKNLINVY